MPLCPLVLLNIYKRSFSFLAEKSWRTFSAHTQNNKLETETTVGQNL